MTANRDPHQVTPTTPWGRGRAVARIVTAGALAGSVFFGLGVTGSSAQTPGAYPEEQVAAITGSAVVYVSIEWSGYVQYPIEGGNAWSDKVVADMSCSGFVADSTGYVVTAGHCADPEEGRKALINQFLANLVDDGTLTAAEAGDLQDTAQQAWSVEGLNDGSAIDRTVKVYQQGAASGVQVAQQYTANVVDNRPLDQGDVTLLKVQTTSPMPELRVADSTPDVGADIAAMGFPGSVSDVVDPSLEPSFKTGRASANQTYSGLPFLQIDAAVSPGMSGGPVVDMRGDVVGIVSFSPFDETQSFNFAAGRDTIASLLARNGVDQELEDADTQFRDGLDSFYAGDYDAAMTSFDAVLTKEPSNASAQNFRTKASQQAGNPSAGGAEHADRLPGGSGVTDAHQAQQPVPSPISSQPLGVVQDSSGLSPLLAIGGAIAALLASAIGLLIVSRRGKRGHQTAAGPSVTSQTSGPMQNAPTGQPATYTCTTCRAQVPTYSPVCGYCGQRQSPMSGSDFDPVATTLIRR